MKLFFILLILFSLSCCAGSMRVSENQASERTPDDQFFEGTGQGYRGPVTVRVRMNGSSVTDIVIVDSAEDKFAGGSAMDELIDLVIMYNSTDIDVVSGATESSRGFLEAVENAILRR
ncbi:MAG: FMN-binding protein [Treponema sp.]|nr:FMN-binding protein [Treponema sp.]